MIAQVVVASANVSDSSVPPSPYIEEIPTPSSTSLVASTSLSVLVFVSRSSTMMSLLSVGVMMTVP